MAAGFVYVLLNPAMEGLVKIGKTTRPPEGRLAELSSATGVPARFTLIFDAHVSDCDSAERRVHLALEDRGLRVSPDREFFRMQPSEAVKAVIALIRPWTIEQEPQTRAVRVSPDPGEERRTVPPAFEPDESGEPWWELVLAGRQWATGSGDFPTDREEAEQSFERAAGLGSAVACHELGELAHANRDEESCQRDAIRWFRKAAERGDYRAWASMARCYGRLGEDENARKMWRKLITASSFGDFSPSQRALCLLDYMASAVAHDWELEHADALASHREEIERAAEGVVDTFKSRGDEDGLKLFFTVLVRLSQI